MMYDITVLLLTHNRPEGMLKALESAFNQTYMNYEVIVLDNGSTTDSYKLVPEEYWLKGNFEYLKFKDNLSIGKRLNQGIVLSRGKYITFLTDDSFWCPEALEVMFNAIDMGPDFVCGKVKTLDHKTGRYLPNNLGNFQWAEGEIKKRNPIHLTSVILRKDLIDKVGGFNENLVRAYDLDLWNRIFRDKIYFKGKLEEELTHLVINNEDGLSNKVRYDFNPASLEENNRLKDYVAKRKSLSFVADENELINKINNERHELLATKAAFDTDFLITWTDFGALKRYQGKIVYYVDYPGMHESNLLEKTDAIMTQFPFEFDKLCHNFYASKSKSEIKKLDKIHVDVTHDMRILCLNLSEENMDFAYVLLEYLLDKFEKITFICNKNDEFYHLCKELQGLKFDYIESEDLEHLKGKQASALLELSADDQDYTLPVRSFLTASMIKVPLITTKNNTLESLTKPFNMNVPNSLDFLQDPSKQEGSYLRCDKLPEYLKAFSLVKKGDVKKTLINNSRLDVYLNMTDSVMVKKLFLFLDSIYENSSLKNEDKDYTVGQEFSDSTIFLNPGTTLSQYVKLEPGTYKGIEVYLNSLENHEGTVFCKVLGNGLKRQSSLKNYQIQQGWNSFNFDTPIKTDVNIELIFNFTSNTSFFEVAYSRYNNYLGVMLINKEPQKACLKFRLY